MIYRVILDEKMAHLALISDILTNGHREDIRQRRNARRIARYSENAFAMTDDEFKKCYRVNKSLFNVICTDLVPLMPKPSRRSDITSRYKVCKHKVELSCVVFCSGTVTLQA